MLFTRDQKSSSYWKLLCAGAGLVSVVAATACSAATQPGAGPAAPSAAAGGATQAQASAQPEPLHATADVSAATGAHVSAGDGAALSIGAHVLQRNGVASISSTDGKVYDFGISVPWSGHVAVTLPVGNVPAGAQVFLAHGISANAWLAEDAVVSGNSITADVSHLSPFKIVMCLVGVNIRDCLAKQLVVYVAEKLAGDAVNKAINSIVNQCGQIILDSTPACKLDDGSLPPALSPHAPNPTITAPGGPIQGGTAPVQGGTAPVQGSTTPVQGSTTPVQGSTTPVQGATTPVQTQPAPPPTAAQYHGGFAATVSPYAITGDSGHKGPGDQYAAGPTYPAGAVVSIYCYVNGESITNSHYNDTTTVWDLSDDGYWYTDAWLYTGKNGPAVPACGPVSAPVSPYAITGDSGHKGPGDQYAAGPTYPAGAVVSIYCYVNGESITNSHYNDTTTVWDLSDDGYWYTDAWLYTGKNGPAVPACG
jgi:hypothetical protein